MKINYNKYNKDPRRRKFKSDVDFIKYFLKKEYKRNHPAKPDPKSLLEDTRIRYDGDDYGDGFVKYGFIPNSEDWSEEDIQEFKKSIRRYVKSPYDCSGQTFTWGIECHRNPNGLISCRHYMGIDV